MGTTFSEPGKAMRSNLTFLGFLRQYVKELSGESTLSIKRLASCCGDFPKLREPLFLYAVFSGQFQTLRSALQAESNESLQKLCDDFGDIVTLDILQKKLSICGLSLKKMQKSPFQNHFRQTESSQSPDESSHSLDWPWISSACEPLFNLLNFDIGSRAIFSEEIAIANIFGRTSGKIADAVEFWSTIFFVFVHKIQLVLTK